MLITRKNVEDVAKSTLQGLSLLESLRKLHINPLDFMQFLEMNPEDAQLLNLSTILEAESAIRNSLNRINDAQDKFELDKAVALNRAAQWLGEKLVSKTYGQKMEVSHTGTIDIRAVLERIDEKVRNVIQVESAVSESVNDSAKLLQADDLIG